eukprot:5604503-Amphidinium_carterae.1
MPAQKRESLLLAVEACKNSERMVEMFVAELVISSQIDEWLASAIEWADGRAATAKAVLASKVCHCLKDYCTSTGKWDLEGLKRKMNEVVKSLRPLPQQQQQQQQQTATAAMEDQ